MAMTRADSLGETMIFTGIDQRTGFALLRQHTKTWLIRTSNTPGMLTVDYQADEDVKEASFHSLRFAYLGSRWESIGDADLANPFFMRHLNKSMLPINENLPQNHLNNLLTLIKRARPHLGNGNQLFPARYLEKLNQRQEAANKAATDGLANYGFMSSIPAFTDTSNTSNTSALENAPTQPLSP